MRKLRRPGAIMGLLALGLEARLYPRLFNNESLFFFSSPL